MGLVTRDYNSDFSRLISNRLTEKGFIVVPRKETDAAFLHEFRNGTIRLIFNYDLLDNFFYFELIYGEQTAFPNDDDNDDVVPLMKVFLETRPEIKPEELQPDSTQYIEALKLNAEMLQLALPRILGRSNEG